MSDCTECGKNIEILRRAGIGETPMFNTSCLRPVSAGDEIDGTIADVQVRVRIVEVRPMQQKALIRVLGGTLDGFEGWVCP